MLIRVTLPWKPLAGELTLRSFLTSTGERTLSPGNEPFHRGTNLSPPGTPLAEEAARRQVAAALVLDVLNYY